MCVSKCQNVPLATLKIIFQDQINGCSDFPPIFISTVSQHPKLGHRFEGTLGMFVEVIRSGKASGK